MSFSYILRFPVFMFYGIYFVCRCVHLCVCICFLYVFLDLFVFVLSYAGLFAFTLSYFIAYCYFHVFSSEIKKGCESECVERWEGSGGHHQNIFYEKMSTFYLKILYFGDNKNSYNDIITDNYQKLTK